MSDLLNSVISPNSLTVPYKRSRRTHERVPQIHNNMYEMHPSWPRVNKTCPFHKHIDLHRHCMARARTDTKGKNMWFKLEAKCQNVKRMSEITNYVYIYINCQKVDEAHKKELDIRRLKHNY